MRVILALQILLFAPLYASAVEVEVNQDVVQTRGGQLSVRKFDDFTRQLFIGNIYTGIEEHHIWLSEPLALPASRDQVVLVNLYAGGNGCAGDFMILRISSKQLTKSPRFGTCSDLIRDVRLKIGRIEIDIAAMNPALEYETFAYTGGQIIHTEHALAIADIDPGQVDASHWAGAHPEEVLRDPAERARFLQIMSLDELNELAVHVRVASATWNDNGVIIGQGCFPHQCNTSNGMWAIDIATGKATALINDNGQIRTFGAPYAQLHWRFHEAYSK